MNFGIVTPSYRNSEWLKLCIASVADQGVEVEHIVQDGGSDDGTLDWLRADRRIRAFVDKDQGMYDAINRGLRNSSGDYLAYLNCDEQYLPGALKAVQDYFESHPQIEVVFGDAVVVDGQGQFLAHRKAILPGKFHSWVSANLAILTCATFFRKSVIQGRGIFFNARRKVIGDGEWILRLIEEEVPMGVLRRFTSVFTETGDNLGTQITAVREQSELFASAPTWARIGRAPIIWHYRLRKLFSGVYVQRPFNYSLYTAKSPAQRVIMEVARPTSRWRR